MNVEMFCWCLIPFANAKVERLFSKMNRVKTIEKNRLGCDCLDLLLRVKKEGQLLRTSILML